MEEPGDSGEEKNAVEVLQAKVSELMERERKLLEEHTRQEADFGLRRAKLKELYLQKEEELRLQSDHTRAVEVELEVLRAQVRELQEELEEARSAVTIAQCTAENDIAVEQRKCQEEIATVQQLMKGECSALCRV
nr:rab GTPase-binding effector protein 1-like [Penaeus vannamei]